MKIIILVGICSRKAANRIEMLTMAWPSLDFLSLQLHTKPIEDSKWSTEEISFTSSLPYVYFHLSMHTMVL